MLCAAGRMAQHVGMPSVSRRVTSVTRVMPIRARCGAMRARVSPGATSRSVPQLYRASRLTGRSDSTGHLQFTGNRDVGAPCLVADGCGPGGHDPRGAAGGRGRMRFGDIDALLVDPRGDELVSVSRVNGRARRAVSELALEF